MARSRTGGAAVKADARALEPQGMDSESLKQDILRHLEFTLGELPRHVDRAWAASPPTARSASTRTRSGR